MAAPSYGGPFPRQKERQSCKVHTQISVLTTSLTLDGMLDLLVPGTGAGDSSDFITSYDTTTYLLTIDV